MNEAEILAFKIGDTTLGENLSRAIEEGAVRCNADGSLEVTERGTGAYLSIRPPSSLNRECKFLNPFMFQKVYASAAVPARCEDCYKIKARLRTLRELVAGYDIAKSVPYRSKWGLDINNRHSQDLYAGYIYLSGLEAARALFPRMREMMDAHPKLGPDVPLVIKRGCSNFEAALGPSDKYTFRPEQREIETYFRSRFKPIEHPNETLPSILYGKWIPFAYQIGDDTYLDFTNGKPLYPKSLSYAP
jgi:hypothetical protein